MKKTRILTGLKPTGEQLHIGNYFGCINPMLQLTKEHKNPEVLLFIPNIHGFTTVHDPKIIRRNTINVLKGFIACGANLDDFIIYNSSDIAAHTQLMRVFMCIMNMGATERMHAYKDAIAKGKANEISVGVFAYPLLMAADILLYDADIVPVGQDQKQHVEFARDIANKFNNKFGDTFKVPECSIKEEVAVVPGVDGRKMSKSYNNFIGIFDDKKATLKKIKQISTGMQTIGEPKDPDTCNVYNILKLFLNKREDSEIRKKYKEGGLSYKYTKDLLYEKLTTFLEPIQKNYRNIDEKQITDILKKNAVKANEIANAKIQEVYKKIGFTL